MESMDAQFATVIYSIGILALRLLTGQLPPLPNSLDAESLIEYKRDTLPAYSRHFAETRSGELKAMAEKRSMSTRAFKRSLNRELSAIIIKACAFDLNQRYDTAIEMGQDIQRHMLNKPIRAMPKSSLYKTKKLLRRNWLSFSIGALFFIGTAVSSALIYQSLISENKAHEQTKAINRFLLSLFSEADPTVNKGEKRSVDELVDKAANKLLENTQLEVRYRAPMLETLGGVFSELGNYPRSAEIFKVALEEQIKSKNQNTHAIAQAHINLANVLTYGHQYQEADQYYQAALKHLAENPNSELHCSAHSQYGNLLRYMGKLNESLTNLDLGIEYCKTENPLQRLFAMENKSYILADMGKTNDAIKILEDGLVQTEKQLGVENPHYIMGLPSLASRYRRTGRLSDAKITAEKGLSLALKVFGEKHEKTAHIHNMLANIHHDLGDYVLAEASYSAAETFYREHYANNLELAFVINNRAALLEDREDFSSAIPLYLESLSLRKALLPEKHYHIGNAYLNLARIHRRSNLLQEAEKYIQQALAIYQSNEPIKRQLDKVALERAVIAAKQGNSEQAQAIIEQAHIKVPERPYAQGRYYLGMAALADAQGKLGQAFQYYELAKELLSKELASAHPLLHFINLQLAEYYHNQNNLEQAKPLVLAAYAVLEENLHPNSPSLHLLTSLSASLSL